MTSSREENLQHSSKYPRPFFRFVHLYFILVFCRQVHLCRDNYTWQERVEAAETLAYLTEINVELQRLASISNHLISVLTTFINYKGDSSLPTTRSEEVRKELIQAAFRVSTGKNHPFLTYAKYVQHSTQMCLKFSRRNVRVSS